MQPIKIFFSCAPNSSKDRKYVDALEKHFADQKRNGEVSIWHVYKTSPGSNEQQEILTHLNNADIILIFQSPDYLDNDFCVDVEGAQAASMQTWGIASVRVLRIRSIDSRTAPFNFCEALPESGEFISSLPYKEEVLHTIALHISTLVKEARNSRFAREAKRVEYSPVLHQAHYMPVMTPVESLIKRRQTDDIKLHKLERKTDEVKSPKRTDELKPRRTNTQTKQRGQVLADNATPSAYASPQNIKSIARTQKRNRAKMREVQNTHKLRSSKITDWLAGADKEYKFMSKGNRGRFFFYPMILIDSFGIAAAISVWFNSWILFGLVFIISLPSVVIGAVNTGNWLPIPLALLYGAFWGTIIHHYLSLQPLPFIGIMAGIALIHMLLFRKNSR